jgi:hypothetical protein
MDNRVRKDSARDVLKDSWLHDVDPREHQWHCIGAAIHRHTPESFDSTIFSFHNTKPFATSVGK